MWILHFLPDSLLNWLVNIILFVGVLGTVAGFFINFIPFVNVYRRPVQIVSIVLMVVGVYLKGGYSVEMEWRARVAELEAQVLAAEQLAKSANDQLEQKMKEKTKVVKDVQVVVKEVIRENATSIDANCKVAPVAIDIINSAARNVKPGANK